MIIDFHTHCYPNTLARKVAQSTVPPQDLPLATSDHLFSQLQTAGVDLGIVLPVATRPDTVKDVNQFAESVENRHHLSFGAIHPDNPRSLDLLDEMKEQGVKGIKFHPPFQHFAVDDPKYRPLYRKIGDLGLITVIHAGRALPSKDSYCYPSTFARVADAFQGAPVVLAHMGGILIEKKELELLPHLPVFVDTALWSVFMNRETLLRLIDLVGLDRVLFGSDYPYATPADCVKQIRALPLSPAEQEQIFSCNAQTLLHWKEN